MSIRVAPVGNSSVAPVSNTLPEFRYARMPWNLIVDRELKDRDRTVYAILAGGVRQGNVTNTGMRWIAEILGITPRRIFESIERLEKRGHLVKCQVAKGKRGRYMLTSEVFGSKQRDGVTEIVSCPKGHRRMVSVGPERLRA